MTCGSQARAARGAPKAEGERGGRIAMRPYGEGRETGGASPFAKATRDRGDPAPQEGRRTGETPALPGRAWEGKGRRQSAAPTREGDGRSTAGKAGACSCPTSLAGFPLMRTLGSGGAHGDGGPAGWEGRWAARKGHPGRTKVPRYDGTRLRQGFGGQSGTPRLRPAAAWGRSDQRAGSRRGAGAPRRDAGGKGGHGGPPRQNQGSALRGRGSVEEGSGNTRLPPRGVGVQEGGEPARRRRSQGGGEPTREGERVGRR